MLSPDLHPAALGMSNLLGDIRDKSSIWGFEELGTCALGPLTTVGRGGGCARATPPQLGSSPEILASPGKAIKGTSPASAAVGATRLSGRPGRWAWGSASQHLCATHTYSSVQAPLTLPLLTVPARLPQVWLMIQSG